MKKKAQRLIIPFSGLKLGMHRFDFEINPEFFEQFEYSIIQEAFAKIEVNFEKKSTLLELTFDFNGTYHTQCDRCTEDISIPLEGKGELIVKFGAENYDQTDDIKIISPDAYELDITEDIYQLLHLFLPSKAVHKDIEDCNPDVIQKLSEINQRKKNEKEDIDPRWDALKKLQTQNKNK